MKSEQYDHHMMNNWCNKNSASGSEKSMTFPDANPGDPDAWKVIDEMDTSPNSNDKKNQSSSI